MSFNSTTCWVCGQTATKNADGNRTARVVSCHVCGNYTISDQLDASTGKLDADNRWKLKVAIRTRHEQGERVSLNSESYLDYIQNTFFSQNPIELVDILLKYLFLNNKEIGGEVKYSEETDYPCIRVKSAEQFHKVIQYAKQLGYISIPFSNGLELTLNGWKRLDEIKRTGIDSNKAFIAMWFDRSMTEFWEKGFKTCIIECGYEPIRIDQTNYNEGVCDEIIAQIRNARFIVADLTNNNSGVYYEAGFAHGLGKPVIFTCKKDYFDNSTVHFDVRHYNIVLYENAEELSSKLKNRISATIVK